MAAVDWSKLPMELLNLISQRIDDEIDLIRFRSTCSTWRSSSVLKLLQILPSKFPLFKLPFLSDPNDMDTINGNNPPFGRLSKQTLYLIKPPLQEEEEQTLLRPRLIRVSRNKRSQTRFFHPLLNYDPISCKRFVLDFNKLSVLHLGSIISICGCGIKPKNEDDDYFYIFPEKVVAATCHGKNPLIVAALDARPFPLLSKCGNENWKVIPDMSMMYGDICLFKGHPYAVDKIGKTVIVGPGSSVHLVAEPLVGGVHFVAEPSVGGGKNKFLVESDGDLLLADVYMHDVRVDLFKLNEKEKKWVKLMSLGDRVLFLGMKCSFSISASDLSVAKGNLVIISDDILRGCCRRRNRPSYVLDLDQGQLPPLSDSPEYSNLFWPPPKKI